MTRIRPGRDELDRRSALRRAAALGSASALIGLGGCADMVRRRVGSPPNAVLPASEWPTALSDAENTGTHPDATGIREDVDEEWIVYLGASANCEPIVVDGTLFVSRGVTGSGGSLYASDLETGDDWTVLETDHYPPGIVPSVIDDTLIAATVDDGLYGFDRGGRNERWRYAETAELRANPTVDRDRAYVGDLDGSVHGIDLEDGDRDWTAAVSAGEIHAGGALHAGSFLVGSRDGSLSALDVTDGSVRWERALPGGIEGAPTIDGGRLYVVSSGTPADGDDGGLYALDPDTGDDVWQADLDAAGATASPVVVGDVVCTATDRGTVSGVDRATGDRLWTRDIDASTDVTAADGVCYLGGDGGIVYALEAETGETHWSYAARDPVFTPTPVDDLLFVSSMDTRIYVLSAQ